MRESICESMNRCSCPNITITYINATNKHKYKTIFSRNNCLIHICNADRSTSKSGKVRMETLKKAKYIWEGDGRCANSARAHCFSLIFSITKDYLWSLAEQLRWTYLKFFTIILYCRFFIMVLKYALIACFIWMLVQRRSCTSVAAALVETVMKDQKADRTRYHSKGNETQMLQSVSELRKVHSKSYRWIFMLNFKYSLRDVPPKNWSASKVI